MTIYTLTTYSSNTYESFFEKKKSITYFEVDINIYIFINIIVSNFRFLLNMQKRNFPYLKDDVKDSCDYLRYKHPAGKTLEEV